MLKMVSFVKCLTSHAPPSSYFSTLDTKKLNEILLIGLNAPLPNWTIDDLLQMNDNETKSNTATAAIVTAPPPPPPLPKRTSLRTRTQLQQQQHHQQQMTETSVPSHTNHKRPSTLDTSINKRLKGNLMVSSFNHSSSSSSSKSNITHQQTFSTPSHEQQKSPHLLQHLMAPSPDRIRKYNGPACKDTSNEKSCSNLQWSCGNGSAFDDTTNQSTGSVLKNLLVSGCDLSAGYVCHVPVRMRKLAKA